jgi:hypothetical protein
MKKMQELITHGKELFKDSKFTFDESVKKIRIDIGLSKEAGISAEWLLEHDDVGVIGIEANPNCISSLQYCMGTNSFINSLYLHQSKICRFVGYVSEVYFKNQILGWTHEAIIKDGGTHRNVRLPLLKDKKILHVAPMGIFDKEHVFKLYSVLEEVKDIKDKFCLIHGAADNIKGPFMPIYQKFYSSWPNIGCSSLIKENIEANERGPNDAAEQFDHKNKVKEVFNVPSFSLDAILEHIDWDTYPFIECIKIDVEGKDLDVLKSCKKYMDRVVYFRAEAHAATNVFVKAKDMVEFMNENNFELFDPEEGDYKFINKKYKKMAKEMNLSY